MSQLPRKKFAPTSKVGNIFEGTGGEFEDIEDISISSCVYEPVLLGLKDQHMECRLEKVFYPQYDREVRIVDTDGKAATIPIEDIEFLAFVNRPLQIDELDINNFTDVIETLEGDTFEIRIPNGQDSDIGFFGITTNQAARYKFIFFALSHIKNHFQQRLFGEIAVEKRLTSEDHLQNALKKQEKLRKLRLGTIIAKRANLKPDDIEAALKNAQLKKSDDSKLHSGDILIEAGLVSPEVVNQSLAFQKKVRGIKVGKMLIDMGYIDENQVYRVLAEKFRKRFVNIQDFSPELKALKLFPEELIRKLKVVPIAFKNNRLIVATSLPDRAEVGEILRKKLSCPFELVVAPHYQIVDAIANLPAFSRQ